MTLAAIGQIVSRIVDPSPRARGSFHRGSVLDKIRLVLFDQLCLLAVAKSIGSVVRESLRVSGFNIINTVGVGEICSRNCESGPSRNLLFETGGRIELL